MDKDGTRKKKNKKKNPFKDFEGFDEFLKNSFENFFDFIDFPEEDASRNFEAGNESENKTKRYSISYKFGTGMDKPEIRVNGNLMDIENFKELFENMPQFGLNSSENQKLALDARNLNISDKETNSETQYIEPFYEIFDDLNENSTGITLELPGVSIENIVISYYGDEVVIIGESLDRIFRKELMLDFVADKDETEVWGKNGVFQIRFKK